ncbi:hypothetical protein D3C84_911780 [compost metagenome]
MFGQHPVEQGRIELGGQIDTFLTLALTAAQVGDHQPRALHQCIRLAKQRRTTVGQAVLSTARPTLLGDTVRIG